MAVKVNDWKLVGLTLDEIGPFRSGPRRFSFMGETAPKDADPAATPGPSNLYMLLAPNGMGKTTVMEAIHGIFGLLALPVTGRFSNAATGGSAQLDVRASIEIDGVTQTVLLSIWTGSEEPLRFWTDDEIDEKIQARGWARLGLTSDHPGASMMQSSNDLGIQVRFAIMNGLGLPPTSGQSLPTVLYFPADRSLATPSGERVVIPPRDWGYSPAYRFCHDGPEWRTTIDNLLVWLEWLQGAEERDENLQKLLDRLSRHVFERRSDKSILRPVRSELTTYVSTPDGLHPLWGLSHGERALVQMFGRILSYSTGNTIVLVDEIELHLHTRWVNRMFREFKDMLVASPGISLLFSTHDRELIKAFEYERAEPGLTKGGFLIDELV